MTSAQTAADLRATAALLDRDGWVGCQPTDGRHCLVTALHEACADDLGQRYQDAAAAAKAIASVTSLIWWNDQPQRTKAEVVALLLAAADAVEREGA